MYDEIISIGLDTDRRKRELRGKRKAAMMKKATIGREKGRNERIMRRK